MDCYLPCVLLGTFSIYASCENSIIQKVKRVPNKGKFEPSIRARLDLIGPNRTSQDGKPPMFNQAMQSL